MTDRFARLSSSGAGGGIGVGSRSGAMVPGLQLRLNQPKNDSENEDERKYRLHETVEVRRDNGVRWITAKISNVYTNGLMYDVRYDDGKEEFKVLSRMIRQIGKEQAGGRQLGLRDDSLDARGNSHSDIYVLPNTSITSPCYSVTVPLPVPSLSYIHNDFPSTMC